MKEPGLDGRHRDQDGRIQQKRGDALDRNLDRPIPGFPGGTQLDTMRERTRQTIIADVRKASEKQKK